MLLNPSAAQVLLLDYQSLFVSSNPSTPEAADAWQQARRLARLATLLKVPLHASQLPASHAGPFDPALLALLAGTPPLLREHYSALSASSGSGDLLSSLQSPIDAQPKKRQGANARSLPNHLRQAPTHAEESARTDIILAGCETHTSVLQTALELLEAEFEVFLVVDACCARLVPDHDAALDRLAAHGVELLSLDMLAREWLRSPLHPLAQEVGMLLQN